MGVDGGVSLHCLHGEREEWRHVQSSSFQAFLHIPFPPENHQREAPPYFSHQNKGFINHSFLQKVSCQKPYWDQARLPSLVNKQVALVADPPDVAPLLPNAGGGEGGAGGQGCLFFILWIEPYPEEFTF